jgi:hypothetical protein
MDHLTTFLSFIAGGGFIKLISMISNRKKTNLEYTEQYTHFLEKNGQALLKRVADLENRVTDLEKNNCERVDCPTRINSYK